MMLLVVTIVVAASLVGGGILLSGVTNSQAPQPSSSASSSNPTLAPSSTATPQSSPTSGSPTATATASPTGTATAEPTATNPTATPTLSPTATPTSGGSSGGGSSGGGSSGGGSTGGGSSEEPTPTGIGETVAQELDNNKKDHEKSADYTWDNSNVISILLNGNSITVNPAQNATVDGNKVTITHAGTFRISGTLTNGQICVDTQDKQTVKLLLNGIDVTCATSSPLYVKNADKVIIILEGNSQNNVADGASYTFETPGETEPNAAVFSKSDLTIYASGGGTLNVDANYNDGIASKDGLVIRGGTVNVNSVDDGIRGKDYLVVKDGDLALNVGGDGLKSDNNENATRGYVAIENGVIDITAGGDAIEAETDVLISGGQFQLTAGGGSSGTISTDASAKAIKGSVCVIIDGGTFTTDSADDAIHSNNKVILNDGTFLISTGDDGIHADTSAVIKNGEINITESYEGIESAVITIDGGEIHIISSDDGINVAGGVDESGLLPGPGFWGPPGGQDNFNYTGDEYLYINGGYITVDAMGDGIDSNGGVEMTDGFVLINGPTANINGALDHATFKKTGGYLLAVGSSGMAQAPSSSSTQYSVLVNFRFSISAGTLIHLQTNDGTELFTFAATKTVRSVVFSSPSLSNGTTYDLYYGGSSTGTNVDGLYIGGTYTPGTKYTTFTISSIVTRSNFNS